MLSLQSTSLHPLSHKIYTFELINISTFTSFYTFRLSLPQNSAKEHTSSTN